MGTSPDTEDELIRSYFENIAWEGLSQFGPDTFVSRLPQGGLAVLCTWTQLSAALNGEGKAKFHRHVAVRFSDDLVRRAEPGERSDQLEELAEMRVKIISFIRQRMLDHYDPALSQQGASFLVDIGIADLA